MYINLLFSTPSSSLPFTTISYTILHPTKHPFHIPPSRTFLWYVISSSRTFLWYVISSSRTFLWYVISSSCTFLWYDISSSRTILWYVIRYLIFLYISVVRTYVRNYGSLQMSTMTLFGWCLCTSLWGRIFNLQ